VARKRPRLAGQAVDRTATPAACGAASTPKDLPPRPDRRLVSADNPGDKSESLARQQQHGTSTISLLRPSLRCSSITEAAALRRTGSSPAGPGIFPSGTSRWPRRGQCMWR